MARIRSIKPELPQSESMGNVSRDARLTFIQLFTLADDEGRLRGNSRMLASLLFPYDDGEDGRPRTTGKDVETWMVELEREGCIVRYQIDGAAYVQIANWLIHQKIDKPSKSKIPPFVEPPRILANPREASSEDQGPRIKDQGEEEIDNTGASAPVEVAAQPDDTDRLTTAPMPPAQDLPEPQSAALVLTLALRPLGVSALSTHPTVIAWADAGVQVETLTEAVRMAREHKPTGTIPPNYLAPIVDKLLNPGAAAPSGRGSAPVNEKFHFSHLDRSGDRAAMEASMQRHGITVPGPDEDLEI